MNHFTLEDALKLNSIHPYVPIDITSDGRWLAYTVYHHKRDEGGGTAKSVTMEDTHNATVWVTETQTGTESGGDNGRF